MAKARTTSATTVTEPIDEQIIETTAVVEEPQTVSEEPTEGGEPTEGNDENTPQTPEGGEPTEGNDDTTTETTEGEEDGNDDTTVETTEDKFIKMSGINKPYAGDIMDLPNFDYYLPVGSGVDLNKRQELIDAITDENNQPTGGE